MAGDRLLVGWQSVDLPGRAYRKRSAKRLFFIGLPPIRQLRRQASKEIVPRKLPCGLSITPSPRLTHCPFTISSLGRSVSVSTCLNPRDLENKRHLSRLGKTWPGTTNLSWRFEVHLHPTNSSDKSNVIFHLFL